MNVRLSLPVDHSLRGKPGASIYIDNRTPDIARLFRHQKHHGRGNLFSLPDPTGDAPRVRLSAPSIRELLAADWSACRAYSNNRVWTHCSCTRHCLRRHQGGRSPPELRFSSVPAPALPCKSCPISCHHRGRPWTRRHAKNLGPVLVFVPLIAIEASAIPSAPPPGTAFRRLKAVVRGYLVSRP